MRARSLVAALAIGLGRITAPAPVVAAPPAAPAPSPVSVATAKKLFQTGLKLYNEGSYREALESFRKANDIAPRASLQRNVAQCHRDLKDFAAAYDAYQTLLSKYGASMTAADRRTVVRAIDELAALTGTVRVTVSETGAAVSLDDREVGKTPLTSPLRANLGPHVVTVVLAGFETIRKDLKLSGGDEVVVAGPLQAEITTGHLVVGAPADAQVEVFIDGTDMGPAPWEGDLKPGVHVVESRGPGHFSPPKQVAVARRERAEIALELAAATGQVQIDTHTADAAIAIDGTTMGKGVWEGPLAAGQHQVLIEAAGFRPYKRAFLVHAGESFFEDARLESTTPQSGPLVYEGLYSGLEFFGFATPSGASNVFATQCPAGAVCQTSSPLGAGLAVRFGYELGWIAVEGIALGSFDSSTATAQYGATPIATTTFSGVARTERYTFYRFGGGAAIGARAASKDAHLRLTGALLGGFATMGSIFTQSEAPTSGPTSTTTTTSSTATYVAPLMLADAGLLVGWANGAKLHVSALVMMQFLTGPATGEGFGSSGTSSSAFNTPPFSVARGTQVFVGPMIGFDFGL